jgi:disulfide bond formation protein DsbB
VNRALELRVVASFGLALACIGALGFAFLLQYGFGMAPCSLCVWERYPYALAAIALIGGLISGRVRLGLAVAALALLGNAALGGYHVGVEQGWFALPGGCLTTGTAGSIEELRALLATARPTCDQPTTVWLGLSLAAWNGIAALVLGLLAGLGAIGALNGASGSRR